MVSLLLVLLLGAAFAGALVFASVTLVRSIKSSRAPTPRKVLTGLLGAGGLAFLGVVGSVVLLVTGTVVAGTVILEHGPVRSIQILRLDDQPQGLSSLDGEAAAAYCAATEGLDPRYPLHLLVDVRGDARTKRMERWIERRTDGHVELLSASPLLDDPELVRLDFGIDVSQRELREFEEEFEEAQPFFDLPRGVRLNLREP